MAVVDSNIGVGMNMAFWIDNASGTLTDMTDYLMSMDIPHAAKSYEAPMTGAWQHKKLGAKGGKISLEYEQSVGSAEAYQHFLSIWGMEALEFEAYPNGKTNGYPKTTGLCNCVDVSPSIRADGVPTFKVELEISGAITDGTYTA